MAPYISFLFLLSLLISAFQLAHAVDPLVDLGYAKYQGKEGKEGVQRWLGMRYAEAPIKGLRFAAPKDPKKEKKVQHAYDFGKSCLSTGVEPKKHTSEDCLFVNVWAPAKAKKDAKLPVYFYVQGGGFNTNSAPRLDGTGLVKASDEKIVVVTINYRVGLYGFLASKEIRDKASLNNGLKDQIKALEWVKKHIKEFGGDPDHVTIGGSSAGAASVYYLLSAYGGKGLDTFHAAAAGSPSFGTQLNVKESQYMYDTLVKNAKCKGKDSLKCLRKIDAKKLQKIDKKLPLPGAKGKPAFMYSPTIDGDLITDYTYRLFGGGKFKKVPTIFGADTNDGTAFVPKNTNTQKDSDNYLKRQWPALEQKHFDRIHNLYPKTNDKFPKAGKYGAYWRQGSNAYGQMRYMCPAITISTAAALHGKMNEAWNFHYDVEDPVAMDKGIGVGHCADVPAIWGPTYAGGPKSYKDKGVNAPIVPVMQGYWTSFIRSFNPNKHRAKGSPEWKPLKEKKDDRELSRLHIKTGETGMKPIDRRQNEACSYFVKVGVELKM
ncbi:hypothetical protein AJ79_08534 [Helicocarpus griseus UAMH5409]|uniref:Carboxylic ester hydrolase n=1 Tax=Helicocarpus griseus UAMH5409 TaxID=1447875 RepID=A0A2B7WS73_9EURO|nr:hypothetical protein AJ79_08534 [Helicocarpus griseus UAMH5409]